MHRASSYYLLTAILLISTISLEALNRPSSNAKLTGLAYYIAVVKKRFQGKPLTRKESETFSSLKKGLLVTLAVTGTLGATGLYRFYRGQSKSNESPPPSQPEPAPVFSDPVASDTDEQKEDTSGAEGSSSDREGDDDADWDDEFAYDDTEEMLLLWEARKKGKGLVRATADSEDEDTEDWKAGAHDPSPDEEQQLKQNLAPKLAPLLAATPDDLKNLPPESRDLPEGLADGVMQRRKHVSHHTLHKRQREKTKGAH